MAGRQSATKTGRRAPAAKTPARLESRLTETLIALAGVPSVSGQEGAVRAWVAERLEKQGLAPMTDAAGNLIVRVPAQPAARDTEPPILLNAHMDRVPPGLAHTSDSRRRHPRSDGATNLGADDSAGIAILLHTLAELRARAPRPSAAAAALHRWRGGRPDRREGVRSGALGRARGHRLR